MTPTTNTVRGKRRPRKPRTTGAVTTVTVAPAVWKTARELKEKFPDEAVTIQIISDTEVLLVNS